jgi:hypothetical protein
MVAGVPPTFSKRRIDAFCFGDGLKLLMIQKAA